MASTNTRLTQLESPKNIKPTILGISLNLTVQKTRSVSHKSQKNPKNMRPLAFERYLNRDSHTIGFGFKLFLKLSQMDLQVYCMSVPFALTMELQNR